jgi:hypothetical protein
MAITAQHIYHITPCDMHHSVPQSKWTLTNCSNIWACLHQFIQEKRDILSNRQHKPNKWKEIPVLSHWVKSATEEALNCSMFWDERSSSVVQRDIPPTSAVSMALICPPLPLPAVSGSLSCSCNTSSKYLHHQTNCQDLCWCCRHTHMHAHKVKNCWSPVMPIRK